MKFLLNLDHLTGYRQIQIETFQSFAEKHNITFALLSNSKQIKDLPVLNKFSNKTNFIKSEPIKFLNYYIW